MAAMREIRLQKQAQQEHLYKSAAAAIHARETQRASQQNEMRLIHLNDEKMTWLANTHAIRQQSNFKAESTIKQVMMDRKDARAHETAHRNLDRAAAEHKSQSYFTLQDMESIEQKNHESNMQWNDHHHAENMQKNETFRKNSRRRGMLGMLLGS